MRIIKRVENRAETLSCPVRVHTGRVLQMAQPIDERVLFAAQRAIARARGQEIFIEPVSDGGDPASSTKLYRVTNTAELEPVRVGSAASSDKKDTAAHKPVKTVDHQRRNWLSRKSAEEAARVVVPRGAAVSAPVAQAPAASTPLPKPAQIADEPATKPAQQPAVEQLLAAEEPPRADHPASFERPDAALPIEGHLIEDESEASEAEVPHINLNGWQSAYSMTADARNTAEACGAFLDHFFAQLKRCGVKNIVLSPGVRSTPLALKARECYGEVHVDSDERSAAFFALGLAKATGNAVALIGSGAVSAANWMPAVLEAEAARVPLILITADKPALLQGHNAVGSCDQLRFFGSHVKRFFQMPMPSKKADHLAFAQQTALDACIACHGSLPNVANADAGPVHINFPFDEPLKPWKRMFDVPTQDFPAAVFAGQGLMPADIKGLVEMIRTKRVIALCGEGTCGSAADAYQLLNFAHACNVPLLADSLSGLRSFSDPMVIDRFEAILGSGSIPHAEVVIRFGRWPVSSRLMEAVRLMDAIQIVVDARDSRDQINSTDIFVHCAPTVFCEALAGAGLRKKANRRSCREWQNLNDLAGCSLRDIKMREDVGEYEGAYIYEVMESAPEDSLVWCANGASMLALDTFYRKGDKFLRVMGNRGMGGVDGVISSALGASQVFDQTTVITGDVAFLHDINALSLQNEFRIRENHGTGKMPSVIIVLLNNCGAGGFQMLSQKPEEESFERLFLNPQSVDFKRLADGFGVTFRTVTSVNTFRRTYSSLLGEAGINIIEVLLPIAGMNERFAEYRRI